MPHIICGMTRNLIRSILCLFYDYSDVDDKILMVDKKVNCCQHILSPTSLRVQFKPSGYRIRGFYNFFQNQ